MPLLASLILSSKLAAGFDGGAITTVAKESAALSRQLGKPVVVEPRLASLNLFVAPHGAAPRVVLRGVAMALSATVSEFPKEIAIRRTPADLSSIDAQRTETRSRWIAKRFADITAFRTAHLIPKMEAAGVVEEYKRLEEQLNAYQRGASPEAPSEDALELLPAAALLKSVVERIGIAKIAAIPSMQCVVYEDEPVPGAIALPDHADLDKEYARNLKPFEAAERPKVPLPPFVADPFAGWGQTADPIEKLRLGIISYSNGIYLTLEGYDRSKTRNFTSTIAVNSAPLRYTRSEVRSKYAEKDRWIELPADDAKAAVFARDKVDGTFPGWLLFPNKVEPLAGVVKDALDAVASDHPSDCVVVCASDDLWDIARNCVNAGRLDLDVFLRSVGEWSTYEWRAENGLCVGRPKDPLACEITRSDRQALAEYARDFQPLNVPRVRLTGRLFHDAAPSIGNLAVFWDFLMRAGSGGWTLPGNLTTYFFRLIGGIGDGDWAALCAGKTLTVGQLGVSSELRALLNSDAALPAELPPGMPDLYRHPNELFPNGGWDDVAVSVNVVQTPMCRMWLADLPEDIYWEPYSQVAAFLSSRVAAMPDPATGKPKIALTEQDAEGKFAFVRFRLGMRHDEVVTLHLPGGARIVAQGPCYGVPTTDPGRYEDLPDSFRKQLWPLICQHSIETAQGTNMTVIHSGDPTTRPTPPPPP